MASIQDFVFDYLDYIILGISLGIVFLILNSLTKRKYRPFFHSAFFLCVCFTISLLIQDILIIVLLPVFIFFILNAFNDKTFRDLVTLEENQVFKEQKPLVWEQYENPPELKEGGEKID